MIRLARPQKVGVEYFPLDVDIDQDDKVAMVEALHGVEGFGVAIKLMMKIYKEGYYYEWTEREQILFSRRVNVDINRVNVIINDCIKWGLFDENLYNEHQILTSKGIQSRYLEIVKRRTLVEFIDVFLLISTDLFKNLNNIVIVDINGVIADINQVNESNSTQSKVKESKVKESIVNNNNGDSCPQVVDNLKDKNLSLIATAFQQNGFGTINATIKELLVELLEEYPFEWIEPAIKKAVESNIRKLSYVKGILKNWNANGGMQLESVDKPKPKAKAGAPNRFHNFDQRSSDYTADELNNRVDEIAKKKRAEARERYKNQGGEQ